MRCAAVDIGTNTLLLLIGEYSPDGTLRILRDEHAVARLGEGVDEHRNISPAALRRATDILAEYRRLCEAAGTETIAAVATSAVRDAANREDILAAMSSALGAPVRVIAGEEEARLSFLGSAEGEGLCTVIDIGGGSTEYITGSKGDILHRTSIDIGAVRLTERWFPALPPSPEHIDRARAEVRRHLSAQPDIDRGDLIGVGGTFTTLAAIELGLQEFGAGIVHGHRLSREVVSTVTSTLLSSSLQELLANPAIHPKRADILPMGALILDESLHYFGAQSCRASTRGLRYGVLMDAPARTAK